MTFSQWARRMPWSLVAVAALLVAAGWLGIARAEELAGTGGRLARQQIIWSILAAAAMLAVTLPNYRVVCRWSYVLFLGALALLVLVYFFPAINGARRWIRVGPVGFQPSEVAKVAFVLALARYLMYRENYRRFWGMAAPLGIALVPVILILREPDLGTALVFLPVFFAMLFAAGARRADLAKLALLGLVTLPLLWTQMSLEQKSRVTALFQQAPPGEAATGDAYHLRQAKQMFALGGTWGSLVTGPVVDDPAAYHLPEARSDFVFCVLTERLGLWGAGVVLGLFALLVGRGLAIARATRDPFGRLVAVGLCTLVAVQVLVNTGMTVGLLPITGLSLPLVSYGGSGLVTQGIAIGLVLNVGLRSGVEVTAEPFRYSPGTEPSLRPHGKTTISRADSARTVRRGHA